MVTKENVMCGGLQYYRAIIGTSLRYSLQADERRRCQRCAWELRRSVNTRAPPLPCSCIVTSGAWHRVFTFFHPRRANSQCGNADESCHTEPRTFRPTTRQADFRSHAQHIQNGHHYPRRPCLGDYQCVDTVEGEADFKDLRLIVGRGTQRNACQEAVWRAVLARSS
jgi:hypothetical protein